MADDLFTIRDGSGRTVSVRLKRDKRLKKTLRWERLHDGSILLRVPLRMPKRNIDPLLHDIAAQMEKSDARHKRRNDITLQQRAELINQKYFGGKIQWNAIRWVSNMSTRLGSCSQGGPTDGEIRLSSKIKSWPEWVVDYVIAHELMHRKHPNHSTAFWNELKQAYPLAEKARGFVEGALFAAGQQFNDER